MYRCAVMRRRFYASHSRLYAVRGLFIAVSVPQYCIFTSFPFATSIPVRVFFVLHHFLSTPAMHAVTTYEVVIHLTFVRAKKKMSSDSKCISGVNILERSTYVMIFRQVLTPLPSTFTIFDSSYNPIIRSGWISRSSYVNYGRISRIILRINL